MSNSARFCPQGMRVPRGQQHLQESLSTLFTGPGGTSVWHTGLLRREVLSKCLAPTSQRVRNLEIELEKDSERKKSPNGEEVGRGSCRWPRTGKTEATFWDPHPVPHFPKGQEPPTPYPGLLASFPIYRWPCPTLSPTPGCTSPAKSSAGGPQTEPLPRSALWHQSQGEGQEEGGGIPLPKWPESSPPQMQRKGDRRTQRYRDTDTCSQ